MRLWRCRSQRHLLAFIRPQPQNYLDMCFIRKSTLAMRFNSDLYTICNNNSLVNRASNLLCGHLFSNAALPTSSERRATTGCHFLCVHNTFFARLTFDRWPKSVKLYIKRLDLIFLKRLDYLIVENTKIDHLMHYLPKIALVYAKVRR